MKAFITLSLVLLSTLLLAQDDQMKFSSSNVQLNLRGENSQETLSSPLILNVDFVAETVTIETQSPKITELFNGQMSYPITATMGELGENFSLTVDQKIFVHFYLDDRKMIMFTRNDIHPKKWGLMLREIEQID